MSMLIDTCQLVSAHAAPWIAIALMVVSAIYGVWHYYSCPYIRGTARIAPEEARARLDNPYIAGVGYAGVMALGIVTMTAALAMIAIGAFPVVAFSALCVGIVVVQVAPVWLMLREAYDRVVAAEASGPDAVAFARDRLKEVHLTGILLMLGLALAIGLVLLAA